MLLYFAVEHWIQTLMVQVARRSASVLKRRKSRNRMEVPSVDRNQEGPSPSLGSVNDVVLHTPQPIETQMSKDSESEVIYYMDEPHPPGKQLNFLKFMRFLLIRKKILLLNKFHSTVTH